MDQSSDNKKAINSPRNNFSPPPTQPAETISSSNLPSTDPKNNQQVPSFPLPKTPTASSIEPPSPPLISPAPPMVVILLGVFSLAALFLAIIIIKPSLFFLPKQETEEPQIFSAEEVIGAEREDLDNFAQIWQNAANQKKNFQFYKKLALGKGGRFKNVPILKIGKETLYGNDLNYLFIIYKFNEYVSAQPIPAETLNEVVNILMQDSTLLQEAEKNGLLALSEDFFNNSSKNYALRNKNIALAKNSLSDKLVEKISGEAVSIWFNNTIVPISVEEGKKLAKEKIQPIYDQLKAGEITFDQASQMIIADSEIGEKIDPDYVGNAYMVFEDVEIQPGPFVSENLNQEARSLGVGQISSIVIGESNDETKTELLFMIIKINEREGEASIANTEDLINNFVDQISKENLNL